MAITLALAIALRLGLATATATVTVTVTVKVPVTVTVTVAVTLTANLQSLLIKSWQPLYQQAQQGFGLCLAQTLPEESVARAPVRGEVGCCWQPGHPLAEDCNEC